MEIFLIVPQNVLYIEDMNINKSGFESFLYTLKLKNKQIGKRVSFYI